MATHYVNNKTLYEEMVKYKEKVNEAKKEDRPLPQIPNYVGKCFLLICNKLATKPNFIGYSYKDEMIADAIENCVTGAHSFDPTKSTNPFAYFTQIAWNAFIRRIQKEKKQAYIKHKNFEYSNIMDDLVEENRVSGTKIHNDYSYELIKNFEEKLTKASKKNKIGIEKFVKEDEHEKEFSPSTS
jgi:hypothetical protein